MANQRNGTLYIGVTNDLVRRINEHKSNAVDGFTKKYKCHTLVWYEMCDSIVVAIQREKQMKKWNRDWKIRLIEKANPNWNDLSENLNS